MYGHMNTIIFEVLSAKLIAIAFSHQEEKEVRAGPSPRSTPSSASAGGSRPSSATTPRMRARHEQAAQHLPSGATTPPAGMHGELIQSSNHILKNGEMIIVKQSCSGCCGTKFSVMLLFIV